MNPNTSPRKAMYKVISLFEDNGQPVQRVTSWLETKDGRRAEFILPDGTRQVYYERDLYTDDKE